MSGSFFIQSLLDGQVIDVKGAKAASGTPLDVFTMKYAPGDTPPTTAQLDAAKNQLWTFVPGPFANSYFIESQLGSNLVIDIEGGRAVSGATVQIYTKKPTGSAAQNDDAKNQLWTWTSVEEPGPAGTLRMSYVMVQSVLDANLVIDIRGASTTAGTSLQVFTKKPTGTTAQFDDAKNQLWSQVPSYTPPPK